MRGGDFADPVAPTTRKGEPSRARGAHRPQRMVLSRGQVNLRIHGGIQRMADLAGVPVGEPPPARERHDLGNLTSMVLG